MEQNFNRRIETDLDLNGPNLAVSSQPSDATVANGASQTFSVTAAASFPGNSNPDNEGTLTYQWYEDDGGNTTKLTNEGQYSGVTTTTLTVSSIESPDNNGNKYYCIVDYTAAEKYGEGGKGTGHPINGSVTSNSATLTVSPFINILSQPSSVDREYNVDGDLTVTAALSDSSYPDDIGYQWYRNDNAISDGRQTSTRIERGTVIDVIVETEDREVVTVQRHNYSFNRTYTHSSGSQSHSVESTASNILIELAGAGGGRGGTDAGGNGGNGGSGNYGKFRLTRAAGSNLTFHAGAKGSGGRDAGNAPGGQGGGFPNYGSGGRGGNSGGRGSSGSGGGGGGTSDVIQDGTTIIVSGGGGGGGGASHVRLHGGAGGNAGAWDSKSSTMYSDGGQGGHPCERADGGGGGGGGAGYVSSPGTGAGAGGAGGGDGYRGGLGGEGGQGAYRSDYVNLFVGNVGYNGGQGYVNLSYDYYVDVYDTRIDTITTQREVEREIVNSINQHIDFSGTKGKTLTVKADYNTVENLKCIVSSPTATNSPVTSDTVQFSSHSDLIDKTLFIEQAFWQFSRWRGGDATGAMRVALSNVNLTNGEVALTYDDGTSYESVDASVGTQDDIVRGKGINVYTSFYVTSDTEVEIDLYGGKGVEWTSLTNTYAPGSPQGLYPYDPNGYTALAAQHSPGNGGYGRIRFTMKANREYTVAGMFSTINTPHLYERDEIIAVVGQGGGNNVYAAGGAGGGLNLVGEWGQGGTSDSHGGRGGVYDNGSQVSDNPYANGPGMRLQAVLGSAYYPYRKFWDSGGEVNSMLDHIAAHNDGAQQPDTRDTGRVKRYSRSINNNSNIGTRKMWTRQANGGGTPGFFGGGGLMPEQNVMENTATIERGFWDIDYAFLGTAGGRSNGTPSFEPKDWYKAVERQNSLNQMAMNNAKGLYDLNCVGGNGAWGGAGGRNGGGGGGGAGYVYLDKGDGGITLVSTSSGASTGNSKIVIRLAT